MYVSLILQEFVTLLANLYEQKRTCLATTNN